MVGRPWPCRVVALLSIVRLSRAVLEESGGPAVGSCPVPYLLSIAVLPAVSRELAGWLHGDPSGQTHVKNVQTALHKRFPLGRDLEAFVSTILLTMDVVCVALWCQRWLVLSIPKACFGGRGGLGPESTSSERVR